MVESVQTPNGEPIAAVVVGPTAGWLTGWVEQQLARRYEEVCVVENAEQATALLTDDPESWLTVFPHQRPGELSADLPAALMAAVPLARLLSVAGSWCEGELRTGAPWPNVERVYWHQFNDWLNANTGMPPAPIEGAPPLISLHAMDWDTTWALSDALLTHGFATVRAPIGWPTAPAEGIAAAVWVGSQLDGPAAVGLAQLCREMRERKAPVVALLDFPRPDELQLAEAVGVAAVFGKPWCMDHLARGLAQCLSLDAEAVPQAGISRAA